MSWDPVNTLCEQLVKAVTAMMDPASTQRYRLEALKILEHVVKYELLVPPIDGTQNILEEESHIKDVLSRIVVEMIK
ncbi:hypothetical protein E2320_011473, partial [Naja naja]